MKGGFLESIGKVLREYGWASEGKSCFNFKFSKFRLSFFMYDSGAVRAKRGD